MINAINGRFKKLFTLFLLLCCSLSLTAQLTYEKRLEFELNDDFENEKIIEFEKTGFLIRSKNKESAGKETEWKYELFNTNLESIESRSVFMHKKYFESETYNNDEMSHTLYQNRKGEFSIVSVKAATLEIKTVEGIVPKKSNIKEMAILGDYAFFNAYMKRAPYLFSVNWKTGKQRLIPISLGNFGNKSTSLLRFQVMEKSNEIFLYAKVIVSKGNSEFYVIRLNKNGEKEDVLNITKTIDQNIIDISASKVSDNTYIYTGTYSTKYTSRSEGLFFCQVQNNEIDYINFHNYLDLKNFLSYLSEKRKAKIAKTKAKKERKGKEFNINYRIANHDVILLNDGYLMLGEAFYPTYRTETYTTTSNGVTTTQTRQVFDGYQYTHAVLAKFNKEGELQWDETFEMWPAYKPFTVKRFISIAEQNENAIKMVFVSRNQIITKSIDTEGTIVQEQKSEAIETGHTGDKLKYAFSNIDYWYDNYFIAHGSQKIKNKEDVDVKRKRTVYFISKIKFN